MAMDTAMENLFQSFKRLIHTLSAGKNAARQYAGVTLFKAEVHILERIGKRPGVTSSDIAEAMDVTKGAVSQIVTKLVRKGLVEKRMIVGDKRAHGLHLAPGGQAVFRAHEEYEKPLVEALLAELSGRSEEELLLLARVVGKVTDFVGD